MRPMPVLVRKNPPAAEERKPPADAISSLEHKVAAWLQMWHVEFLQQAAVGGYHVDFLIRRPGQPDLIVEVNGCSVHGCPWCRCRPAWKGQKGRDAKKYAFLLSAGYDVLVLGECQIEDRPELAMARLSSVCRLMHVHS